MQPTFLTWLVFINAFRVCSNVRRWTAVYVFYMASIHARIFKFATDYELYLFILGWSSMRVISRIVE